MLQQGKGRSLNGIPDLTSQGIISDKEKKMDINWLELIITGLVQGLPFVLGGAELAGLVAIVVGPYHLWREYRRKKNQEDYIRDIISSSIKKMLSAKDIESPLEGSPIPILGDYIRKVTYDSMKKEIESFLNERKASDKIEYKDKVGIRDIFHVMEILLEVGGGEVELLSIEFCQAVLVEPLKEIKWLKLD